MKAAFSGHIAQLTFNAPHQQKQPDLTNTNPQGQPYNWWKALRFSTLRNYNQINVGRKSAAPSGNAGKPQVPACNATPRIKNIRRIGEMSNYL